MGALPPEITKRIHDEIIAETEKKFCTKTRLNKLAKELDLLAFSDITDYVTLGENGSCTWNNPEELRYKKLTRAIKKIKRRKVFRVGDDGQEIITDEVDFELYPKIDAIREIIGIMGLKAPAQIELNHGVKGLTDEQLNQLIQKLMGSNGSGT